MTEAKSFDELFVDFLKTLTPVDKIAAGWNADPDPKKALNDLLTALELRFKPLLAMLPEVSKRLGTDVAPTIAGVFELGIAIMSDRAVLASRERLDELITSQRIKMLKRYQKAGFTRSEAFQLVLQNAAKNGIAHVAQLSQIKTRSR